MSGTSGPPAAFGRYRPLEELGTGAMGKVYLAIDPLIDRRVAVKVISAQGLSEEDRAAFLNRFRTDVRAAALCAHPAIVSVYDFADDGPTLVGDMIGTPGYMAPEQALGQTVEHRTDLFATTAVLYEILHGRPPFSGGTMAETLLRLTGPAPAELGTWPAP